MKVKELKEWLSKYDDDFIVGTFQNSGYWLELNFEDIESRKKNTT